MLTEQEMKAAKKAISEGYTDNFMFGLERGGSVLLKNINEAKPTKVDSRTIYDHIRIKQ